MNEYYNFENNDNNQNNNENKDKNDNNGFYYQNLNDIVPPNQREGFVKEKKPFSPIIRTIALMLACAIIGSCAGVAIMLKVTDKKDSQPFYNPNGTVNYYMSNDRSNLEVNKIDVKSGEKMTTSQIFSAYGESIVCIEVATLEGTGAGTGFLISEDGYILTCYHVIDGATDITVKFSDTTAFPAVYVGGDSDEDTAVLKIVCEEEKTFKPVILGNSDILNIGDTVISIGNALGTLANTTTAGIVSAKNRAITMEDGTVMNLLQTDCTINSGNSGGPLFNEYGEVVGIVNAKYSSSKNTNSAQIEGIGFAIPMSTVQTFLEDIILHGYITGKPSLGISVSTVSALTAQKYKGYVVGAYIAAVNEGSCSEKAGLLVGDIITGVDDKPITSSAELIDAKGNHRAGEDMKLNVYRYDSKTDTSDTLIIVVTLDEQKPTDGPIVTEEQKKEAEKNKQKQDQSEYFEIPFPFSDFFGGWPFF